MYVDFEDAFQDENTNHDYFGFQPQYDQSNHQQQHRHSTSRQNQDDSNQPANFYLQSVETISEVKNSNFSPFIRYQLSRENSRPSTPSDTPPYLPRSQNHLATHLLSLPPSSNSNMTNNLHRDFTNLNLIHSNQLDNSSSSAPAPFTPDAIRIKIKPTKSDDAALLSSQFKFILPQYFLVKYLGRTTCTQLWGSTAVRAPIDDMVHSARQLSSMNEIPTLEACINTRGLTLTHRNSPVHSKHQSRNNSPDRQQQQQQHGLIPLEYISYVMHDTKYSKVAACIVLRQSKSSSDTKVNNETITECYSFLFQSKEHAHRFALSLAEAFNAQKHSSRTTRPNHEREGRSPQRRSRHRSSHPHHHHHHERTRNKYDDTHLRDSEV